MIGRLVKLALALVGAGWLLDRGLAGRNRSRDAGPAPVHTFVVVDAPIDLVWRELADIEGQPRWMADLVDVDVLDPGPIGVGTRAIGSVAILGLRVDDPVTITAFESPRRFAISHDGVFRGRGTIDLRPGVDGSTTIVDWRETLVAPVLPFLWAALARPVLRATFQADLERLRELVEQVRETSGAAMGVSP